MNYDQTEVNNTAARRNAMTLTDQTVSAIDCECSNYEWWCEHWCVAEPYSSNVGQRCNSYGIADAPVSVSVSVTVLTHDPLKAGQLLRILSAELGEKPDLLKPLFHARHPEAFVPGDFIPL